ncbi:hypothetical protein AB1Y20_020930 [Prymnesium parvum]
MELETDAGKPVFNGGIAGADCNACLAVAEDLQLAMKQPFEKVDIGKDTAAAAAARQEVNRALYVAQVVDPHRCRRSMKAYDLAHRGAGAAFVRDAAAASLPVHMELNEWAKEELAQFCEVLMEEHEEILGELVLEGARGGELNLSRAICEEKLGLCGVAIEQPPEKKKDPNSRGERLKKARQVFKSMDKNKDGKLTREEVDAHSKSMGRGSPEERLAETERFLRQTDTDGDGQVNFDEYKKLWLPPKAKRTPKDGEGGVLGGFVTGAIAYVREDLWPKVQERYRTMSAVEVSILRSTLAALFVGGALLIRRR